MNRRKRAEKLHRIKQGFVFALTVLSFVATLTPSPFDPDVSDLEWNALGHVLTIMFAFVYVLNNIVGPNYGDGK